MQRIICFLNSVVIMSILCIPVILINGILWKSILNNSHHRGSVAYCVYDSFSIYSEYIDEKKSDSAIFSSAAEFLNSVSPAFRISDIKREQWNHYLMYGNPYNYSRGNDLSYIPIPFGYNFDVLIHPNYSNINRSSLFVLMLSEVDHLNRRSEIRKYFNSIKRKINATIIFALGQTTDTRIMEAIRLEGNLYGDILQFDHIDCYHNITLSVLHSLQYIHSSNLQFDYFVKTDDDCVINMALLSKLIASPSTSSLKYLYMGNCYNRAVYNTENRELKTFVPKSVIELDPDIPNYATGGAYVLSRNMISNILLEVRHLPFITHQEDVTIGRAVNRAGAACTAPRPEKWISKKVCQPLVNCQDYVVVHLSNPSIDLTSLCKLFSI